MSNSSEDRARKEFIHGKSLSDGVLRRDFRYSPHSDEVNSRLEQSSRDAILNYNRRLRNEGVVGKGLEWGRMVAQIPLVDLEVLKFKYPELQDERHPDYQKTLMKILSGPEGLKYRIVEKV